MNDYDRVVIAFIANTLKDDPDFYDAVVDLMENLDEEDFFGTEGWRHRAGLEFPR